MKAALFFAVALVSLSACSHRAVGIDEPDGFTPQSGEWCGDTSAPVLLVSRGLTVLAVHGDGSLKTIYDFTADGATIVMDQGAAVVGTAGRFALLGASVSSLTVTQVLVDLTEDPPAVKWRRTDDSNTSFNVSADGTVFALPFSESPTGYVTTAIALDGTTRQVPGYPKAILPSGDVIVTQIESDFTVKMGWWTGGEPRWLGPTPSDDLSSSDYFKIVDAHTVAYIDAIDSSSDRSVVLSTLSADRRVTIPGSAGRAAFLVGQGSSMLVVVSDDGNRKHFQLDAVAGTLTAIPMTIPAGQRDFTDFEQLTPDGNLVTAFRDDVLAGTYLGSGNDWTLVGETVSNVDSLYVRDGRGGTYVVSGQNNLFVPAVWTPPTATETPAHTGPTLQIIRPGTPTRIFPAVAERLPDVTLSADGACGAYFPLGADGTPLGQSLTIMRIADGETLVPADEHGAAIAASAYPFPVWRGR